MPNDEPPADLPPHHRSGIGEFNPSDVKESDVYRFLYTHWHHLDRQAWRRTETLFAVEAAGIGASFAVQKFTLLSIAANLSASLVTVLIFGLISRDLEIRDSNYAFFDAAHERFNNLRVIPRAKVEKSRGAWFLTVIFQGVLTANMLLALLAYDWSPVPWLWQRLVQYSTKGETNDMQKPKSSEQQGVPGWLAMTSNDDPTLIIDKPVDLKCPHCGAHAHLVAISTPRWKQMTRYSPKKVLIGYLCGACREPIALKFRTLGRFDGATAELSRDYEEIERPLETFEFEYLPEAVAADFREALTCFSVGCPNASAAMCRRTIQTVATDLGTPGKAKVKKQIEETKELLGLDEDTSSALEEVMLGGHDGAHPNLPPVSEKRAAVLIDLMKDVLDQLYIRKASIQAAKQLRQRAIDEKKAQQ